MVSYSHGLEKIYSFETVNPTTVRQLVQPEKPPTSPYFSPAKASSSPPRIGGDEELLFDFGEEFSEGLPSFRLDEPIERLGLSPFALKTLTSQGIHSAKELYQALPSLKAYADEVREKITVYLGAHPLVRKKRVDFAAIIASATTKLDPKERHLLLQRFNLEHIAPLKPIENAEIQKWTQEMRQKAYEKGFSTIHRASIEAKWNAITIAYVKPWLRRRLGIAPLFELHERLYMISEKSEDKELGNILAFSKALAIDPFQKLFFTSGIYADSEATAKDVCRVVEQAQSYLYKSTSCYPLQILIRFIERDFAIEWIGFSESFIETVLRFSDQFTLLRDKNGNILLTPRV
jgi:hypothetical protein